MMKYFTIDSANPKCTHVSCQCPVIVRGVHHTTDSYEYVAQGITYEERVLDASAAVAASWKIVGGVPQPAHGDRESDKIKLSMSKKGNMIPVQLPKSFQGAWPESRELGDVDPDVHRALLKSDYRYLLTRFHHVSWDYLAQEVWPRPVSHYVKHTQAGWVRCDKNDEGPVYVDDPIPSLKAMIFKKESSVWQTTGTVKGRPFVLSAMEGLYPDKHREALLNMNRPTHKPPLAFEEIKKDVPKAMDLLYHKMGIHEFEKEPSIISLGSLDGMYLGASNGINFGKTFVITDPDFDCPIEVSPKGKKVNTFESDLNAILDFIRTGEAPPVYWNVTPKDENFFSWSKQASDKDWEAWKKKVRLFVIPSSIFILGEKMVSKVRHMKERGWVISVGYAHSRGGADKLALMLGINKTNCRAPVIEEGDAAGFDQTVLEFFVNLYYSTMQIHEDPSSPDYAIKREITKWLLSNMITRLTRLFGSEWVWMRGQVPSGCYNTSHMDSWIMAMYFFLFGIVTIDRAPDEDKEELEDALLNIIRIIVYGDDHLYNKGTGKSATYFSAHNFAAFCNKYYGVTVRDILSGTTFVSDTYRGWIVRRGCTYLKHQFIENPCKDPGQCDFLPFRESREFMIRALWGRNPSTKRNPLNVVLSVIGHAYGTYASNPDAYKRLQYFYEELIIIMKLPVGTILAKIMEGLDNDDLKKLRQLGIVTDDLLRGFPTWSTLVGKNVMDWAYHNNIVDGVDVCMMEDW